MNGQVDVLKIIEDKIGVGELYAAVEELIEAGDLLQRAFAFNPSVHERYRLQRAGLGPSAPAFPHIALIRRAAKKRFRAALARADGRQLPGGAQA